MWEAVLLEGEAVQLLIDQQRYLVTGRQSKMEHLVMQIVELERVE